MREKTKEFLKKNLIGFILGLISACTISVIAATYFPSNDVTYDNTESGLASTNVQGAIDEIYTKCTKEPTASDQIIELLPNNPDELYKDDKENIRYYGKNPNNYLYFNCTDNNDKTTCELWRIIGVIDGKIKIKRNNKIGNKNWSSNSFSNNWENSDLQIYLNNEYYNSINEPYKGMISEETYYLGGPTESNQNLLTASGYYDVERSNIVYAGNPISIKQYIGLIYPSDYGYATGSSCLSAPLSLYANNNCYNNYLYKKDQEIWLQTPDASANETAALVMKFGYVYYKGAISEDRPVFPTLYLSSEVQITGGDGSKTNPYELSI